MLHTITKEPISKHVPRDPAQTKLERTCVEFEAIFISHMMKSMRSSIPKSSMADHSREGDIINAMFDERLAERIAGGGGIGLASILFSQLKD
jgi:flagellar protein FlgJ